MIEALTEYYTDIGRTKRPKYEDYSLCELRKCIVLFKLRFAEKK